MPRRWLQHSAQGFNPGTLKINEFALKGLEADQINLAPISWAEIKCDNQDVLHLDSAFKLLVRCPEASALCSVRSVAPTEHRLEAYAPLVFRTFKRFLRTILEAVAVSPRW